MDLEPVVTQYVKDGGDLLERSTYQALENNSDYIVLLEETSEGYVFDYREEFTSYDLDPRHFREKQPRLLSSVSDVEEVFSEILDGGKRKELAV